MIIVRSPLRISLGGGGTDLESYYKNFEGFVISAAIDKYIFTTVMRPFSEGIFLKYSKLENVTSVDQVQHPIIREVLQLLKLKTPQVEITTLADIPSGTGLGSSGSFTTSLIKALFAHYNRPILPRELAELACEIEIRKLGEPIGKQDQYISSIGGVSTFEFKKDGAVIHNPLPIKIDTIHELEDNLLLFFTGISRSASKILKDQNDKSNINNLEMLNNLHYIKDLGLRSYDALVQQDMYKFADLMNEHWNFKKNRSTGMSNSQIDFAYSNALKNGAIGGKVVGAGGGGFLLFYAVDKKRLREMMKSLNMPEVRFKFDFEGTKVIYS
jgi:D-glycero-alpha-D-manno-heptose-7-phosphate kinase